MFVYILLLLTLGTGLAALFLLWRAGPVVKILAAASLAGFVFLYGAWVYLSSYLAQGFGVLALLVMIAGFIRNCKKAQGKAGVGTWVLLICTAAMNALYFTGTTGKTGYADLSFPLHAGDYYVLQGGKGLPANVFHYNSRRAVYAMDLVRLDRYGRRAGKVFSKNMEDYYIFGDTVFAPCDGIIERAIDDNPDNIPPHRERGPHNLNGVIIDGAEYTVFMGHMQYHKVFVRAGDAVKTGQALGLAGNSGMSIEPHLHIQVHKKSTDGSPWYRQPQLFIRFGGKGYLLFQRIRHRS
jgi:hypothetical protein